LARLKEREDALNVDLVSQKTLVIEDIERKQEFISPIQKDEYIKPLSFSDAKEEEHEDIIVNTIDENEKVMGLIDTSNDIVINDPSSLLVENVIDYIISHNEMVNLVVDVSTNMKKTPTSLKFLSSYFALIYSDKDSFRIVIRQDKYVVNELIKLHPNIVKTYNGSEEDWYTLYIDSSYSSYDELYSIFLSSYNYTKTNYYKKISSRK
ncbi:MAG: hypothetical protein PUB23_04735, partial [Bacilli bacterium]|nr:hypothetical protein [Bacilli bacterium]